MTIGGILMNQEGILVVVSGFSGAGKGTLIKALMETHDNYALSISATTRQPRAGETDGKEGVKPQCKGASAGAFR